MSHVQDATSDGRNGEGVRCLSASASFATTRLWWCVVAYTRTNVECVCARAGGGGGGGGAGGGGLRGGSTGGGGVIVIDATLR